jgi:hypothetical protein
MADRQPSSSSDYSAAGYNSSSSYRAAAGDAGADGQEGLGVQVHPEYGYAELGGVDPNATMVFGGQNQPGVHPTRKFTVRDMYNPTVRAFAVALQCHQYAYGEGSGLQCQPLLLYGDEASRAWS